MFSENSMLHFKTPHHFKAFYRSLALPEQWRITTEDMNYRGQRIYKEQYVLRLKHLFNKKKLFRRSVSIAEVVSFLDSYYIIEKVTNNLQRMLNRQDFLDLSMCAEYKIRYSKNRRIDYVYLYGNSILIVEFRLSNSFPNVSNVWQRKETELLIYKELLRNYIPDEKRIIIYAFIAMPEYDGATPLYKQIKYNNENARFFAEYIHEFLIKPEKW